MSEDVGLFCVWVSSSIFQRCIFGADFFVNFSFIFLHNFYLFFFHNKHDCDFLVNKSRKN